MSEAATPDVPVAPATPVTPPASAETVTLTKEQHEQLTRDAARAASAQRKLDRYEQANGRANGTHFKSGTPAKAPEPKEGQEDQGIVEDRKAERGLMTIAADPAFREVLDADPTLRNLLTQNPLGVLPLLAPDALDAEDAIDLVRGKLVERASGLKKPPAVTPEPKPADAPVPKSPPAGGVNATTTEVDARYEEAKKLPNTERAIAGMIGAKLSGMKSSK